MMKRMVSLILTLAMVMSLMAGMAVGVGATEAATTSIDKVEINYTEPVVGQPLPMPVAGEGNYKVDESSTGWYDYTAEQWVSAGTVAEQGHIYYLDAWVAPAEGYMFTEDTELYVNGEFEAYDEGSDGCIVWASPDYAFCDPIDKVELSYAEPEEGKALAAPAVPDGANYTIDYFRWYDYEAGEEAASGTLAQAGGRYDLYVQISAAEGYMFTEDMQLWVNGQQEEDISYSAAEFTWNSDIYDLSIPISKVEITYSEPEVGKELAMPVAKGTTYTVSEETQWYDYMTDEYVEPGTVAQNGHKYELMIHVDAATGYKFLGEAIFWVNGVQIGEDEVSIDSKSIYYCTQIFDFTQKINEVSVTCAEPVVGQPVPQPVVPSNANYSVTTTWYDGYTDETVTGNVKDGDIYYVEIYIEPAAGYEFVEDTKVTFNSEVQGKYDSDLSADRLILNEVYSFAQPIDKIEVFYELPEAGKAPSAITIPQGANYSLNEEDTGWFYNGSYDKVTGVFEDGYRYDLNARVELERGYQLEPYVTQIYVNGEMYTYTGGGGNWLDTAVTVYGPSFSLAQSVDKVELPAWPELKVGDELPSISGSNEYYEYYYMWEVSDADGDYVNTNTVKENMLYYCYAMAEPKEGYEFTEDTVITLGGAPLSDWGYVSYTYASDTKVYNFGAVQELDPVNVIASVPGIGQSGGAVAVPADAGYILEEAVWVVASNESFEDMTAQKGTYKAGDRVGLLVVVQVKDGYIFKCGAAITINGQEYPIVEQYPYYDYVYVVLDLGEAQEGPKYNGLTNVDGVWGYYEGGVLQVDYTGLVPYGDILFYVENGILDFSYTGLVWYNDAWRYVANSQLTEGYTGLVWFNDNWFYTVDSVIDWTFTGLVPYEGNYFYVQNNLLDWSYTGLGYHDGGWYFIQNGLLQKEYSGLVYFNDNWFYVEEGVLTYQYFGMVEYQGNMFYVQASHLDWSYTGLGYHEGNWYYFQNALYMPEYNGLVPFNGSYFYVEDGLLTWTTNGLHEHEGKLYYITNSEWDATFNGTAEYNGTTYNVVNGVVEL